MATTLGVERGLAWTVDLGRTPKLNVVRGGWGVGRERGPGQRLVAEGSKRLVVVAAGVMVGQRERWIEMKLTVGWEGNKMGSRRLVVAAEKMMAVQRQRQIRTEATWAV